MNGKEQKTVFVLREGLIHHYPTRWCLFGDFCHLGNESTNHQMSVRFHGLNKH